MKNIATGGHSDLKRVNPAAAAIDIGSTMHMAAISHKALSEAMRDKPDIQHIPARRIGRLGVSLHSAKMRAIRS